MGDSVSMGEDEVVEAQLVGGQEGVSVALPRPAGYSGTTGEGRGEGKVVGTAWGRAFPWARACPWGRTRGSHPLAHSLSLRGPKMIPRGTRGRSSLTLWGLCLARGRVSV